MNAHLPKLKFQKPREEMWLMLVEGEGGKKIN